MAKKNTYLKPGIIILALILIAVFVNGFLDGYQDSIEKSDLITEVLEENCDCDEVNRIIYAKGLQFGKDGISTEKAEYELIDCNYQSIMTEAVRINIILKKEVKGFDAIDLLTLEFNNHQNREKITIKNGIIQ
ncbi:hypothetical protein UMM65_06165 [Aureibaculum sp. 2210JD6-5]|uniref:hypothetical protein n=1 Tax=Aureibaculum sp. 2210JD6-5 TaxID=3103957 RepID=UPI002AAF0320|nr:hypothetical protein [Aureibaculum sp. 2210JD6-5]MDY7394818.1 hypothetical protein [Aureibaculum sp. 2210JD6-5]